MSAVADVQDALVAALAALFPASLVCIGDPETLPQDIVSIGDSRSAEEPTALTPAGRWEVIDQDVTFSSARSGSGATVAARDAVIATLDGLRTYLRVTSPTVAGACLGNGGVVDHELRFGGSPKGRVAEMTATVRLYAEVSG